MAQCDWCKKDRKTRFTRVAMTVSLSGMQPALIRDWHLCLRCRTACKRKLRIWALAVPSDCVPDDQPE